MVGPRPTVDGLNGDEAARTWPRSTTTARHRWNGLGRGAGALEPAVLFGVYAAQPLGRPAILVFGQELGEGRGVEGERAESLRRRGFVATKPHTIDEYLAGLTTAHRAALQKVRRAVHAAAPEAQECISYGMPAFRLHGKLIAGFRSAANHCAFHPMSGATVATLKADLVGYDTSRGTIRFSARAGLPAVLVRKLVKARIAEVAGPVGQRREGSAASCRARG